MAGGGVPVAAASPAAAAARTVSGIAVPAAHFALYSRWRWEEGINKQFIAKGASKCGILTTPASLLFVVVVVYKSCVLSSRLAR